MPGLLIIFIAIISLVVILDFSMILFWVFNFREKGNGKSGTPFISILVAARNEEHTLASCLESLLELQYPTYEVLIGNDNSEDRTARVARRFASRDKRVKVFDIEEIGMEGKANALAQLARNAKGEFFFFTDADVQVPGNWINAMLDGFDYNVGVVMGATGIKPDGLWARFQNVDWLLAIGMIKVISDTGIPVTAMGNNMAIKREAYQAVGGFGSIPASLTEDFEICRQIRNKGFRFRSYINQDVYAKTTCEKDVIELLYQRKRWMRGVFQLPFHIKALLIVRAFVLPAFIGLFIISPILSIALFILKISVQSTFFSLLKAKLNKTSKFSFLFLYEFYSGILSLALIIFYFLPGKIKWKGREY